MHITRVIMSMSAFVLGMPGLFAQNTVLLEDFATIRFSDGSTLSCPSPQAKGAYSASATYSQCDFVSNPGAPSAFVSRQNNNVGNALPINTGVSASWGVPIFNYYTGENGGQQFLIQSGPGGFMQGTLNSTGNSGLYDQFLPTEANWAFPNAYVQHWIKSGTWSAAINRLTFQYQCNMAITDGGPSHTIEIGTYIRPQNYSDASWAGQHYYHFLAPNVYPNRWIYATLNKRPEHRVGAGSPEAHPDDPEQNNSTTGTPVHYYDGMTRFYIDWVYKQSSGLVCQFANFQLSTVSNELDGLSTTGAGGTTQGYMGAITATYSGPTAGYPHGRYEAIWQGPSQISSGQSYNIRYSTSDMHVTGFSSGTSGGVVTGPGGSDYTTVAWYSPDMSQATTMYVAIQPVGQTAFAEVQIPGVGGTPVVSQCDPTGDGVVNNADVQLAINQALGFSACTDDLNGDGLCTVLEVQRIINAAMGGTCRVGQ
jgi:hypothetical protein